MRLTPLDIQQQQFRTALRGFEKKEVDAFLGLLSAEYADLTKENQHLREDVKRLQGELEEHREREETLKATMITAQRIAEDMKTVAKKEADIILGEAEIQAEKLLHSAQNRMLKIIEDITDLKRQRVRFEQELRNVIDTHHKLLQALQETERDGAKLEDNLKVLAARQEPPQPARPAQPPPLRARRRGG